jgi:hypothetical protein
MQMNRNLTIASLIILYKKNYNFTWGGLFYFFIALKYNSEESNYTILLIISLL